MTKKPVTFKAKCTSCGKTYIPTDAQIAEGNDFGCLMSSRCMSLATVEQVTVKAT
jgi:hypothetical protein